MVLSFKDPANDRLIDSNLHSFFGTLKSSESVRDEKSKDNSSLRRPPGKMVFVISEVGVRTSMSPDSGIVRNVKKFLGTTIHL